MPHLNCLATAFAHPHLASASPALVPPLPGSLPLSRLRLQVFQSEIGVSMGHKELLIDFLIFPPSSSGSTIDLDGWMADLRPQRPISGSCPLPLALLPCIVEWSAQAIYILAAVLWDNTSHAVSKEGAVFTLLHICIDNPKCQRLVAETGVMAAVRAFATQYTHTRDVEQQILRFCDEMDAMIKGPSGVDRKQNPSSPGGGGGDPSVLDANYPPPPPQLTVGRRPLGGGALEGGAWEGLPGRAVPRGGGGVCRAPPNSWFGFWFLGRPARAGGKVADTLSLGRAQGSSARTTPLAGRATDARWFLRGGGGGGCLETVGLGSGCAWGGLVVRVGVCARGWVGRQGTTGSAVCHGTAPCPNMFHPKAVPSWSRGLERAAGVGSV